MKTENAIYWKSEISSCHVRLLQKRVKKPLITTQVHNDLEEPTAKFCHSRYHWWQILDWCASVDVIWMEEENIKTPPLMGANTDKHTHACTQKENMFHKWQAANTCPLDFLNGSNRVLKPSDWQGLSGKNEYSGKGRLAHYDKRVAAVRMRRPWLDHLDSAVLIPPLFWMSGWETEGFWQLLVAHRICACVCVRVHECGGSPRMWWVSVSEGSLPLDAHSSS